MMKRILGKGKSKGKLTVEKDRKQKSNSKDTTVAAPEVKIGVATWNILADGLSIGEFMNKGGDPVVHWKNRGPKVASGLSALLASEVSIVATQENDHPTWLLAEIQKTMPSAKLVCVKKGANAPKFYVNRVSDYLSESKDDFKWDGEKPDKKSLDKHARKISDYLKVHPETKKELIDNGFTCTTFKEESFVPGNGENADDFYFQNDCLAVYYDSNVVELENAKPDDNGMFDDSIGKYLSLDFTHRNNGKDYKFTVLSTHLKSGEDEKGEIKRVEELSEVLDKAKECVNPIILMDSNTCEQYADTIKRKFENGKSEENFIFVKAVVESKGFKNVISEADIKKKAIKMRHAEGKQPKKFGDLFFDTIDKILVPEGTKTTEIDLETSVRSDLELFPIKSSTYMNELRNNVELRTKLKDVCKAEKWGPDMTYNNTDDFDEFVKKTKFGDFGSVKNVLLHLYPNDTMPSDHPPVAVSVTIPPPS